METTLVNPNQLRHFGTQVQDNPTAAFTLSIISEDDEFSLELTMAGTIVCVETFTPSETELLSCPHIQLTSQTPWDPHKVRFHPSSMKLDDVMANRRQVSST